MAHTLTIGRHLECALQTELVVESDIPLIGRKQSCRLQYNYVICQKDTKRVRVGWHCAKVKGRAELKIENPRVKTFSCDFPKLHHSNPTVSVLTSTYAQFF